MKTNHKIDVKKSLLRYIVNLSVVILFLFQVSSSFAANKAWERSSKNLIINPSTFILSETGERGFNASDPCVVYSNLTRSWHAFFSSNSEKLDRQSIKHAISSNGVDWKVLSASALTVGDKKNWDSKTVETCSIVEVATGKKTYAYYMYYSGSDTMNGHDKDIYRMGLAYSTDLVNFTRLSAAQSPKKLPGMIFDSADTFATNKNVVKGIVTDPTVLYLNGQFTMWYYCAAQNSSDKYIDGGICRATSVDGVAWKHQGSLPSLLNEKSVGVVAQQPTVIYNPNSRLYEIWVVIDDPAYSSYGVAGLAVGGYYHATSKDGINWIYDNKKAYDFAWDAAFSGENKGLGNGPEVVYRNGTYYLFYSAFSSKGIPAKDYPPFTWGLNMATKR